MHLFSAAATREFTVGLSIYSINALAATFHFFEGGAFVSSKGGGACAMAQWHNGQSKTGACMVSLHSIVQCIIPAFAATLNKPSLKRASPG